MTTRSIDCYVLAGAYGDLCAMLPLFHSEFERTGQKTLVIVKKSYASIFDGVSYCEPIEYGGLAHEELMPTVRLVSGRFFGDAKVHLLNPVQWTHAGPTRNTSSFITEMWANLGRLDEWDKHPLVFDRRSPERESALLSRVDDGRPMVLVATKGKSAPFEHAEMMLEFLKDEISTCNIVDLSTIQCEQVYDLLGLFDKAACLVSIDTMHIHLSRASKVPVVAWVQDKPNMWKGSPWRPRHIFHGRYSEFPTRANEMLVAIQRTLGTWNPSPAIVTINGFFHDSYNPSIIQHDGKLLCAYRWHPDPRNPRTKIAIAELDQDFKIVSNQPITMPEIIRHLSVEDARLFEHCGQLYVSYTVSKIPSRPPYCVVQCGELNQVEGSWMVGSVEQTTYGKNDWTRLEKNWVYFSDQSERYAIYSTHGEQIILRLDYKGNVVEELRTEAPEWKWGEAHGGTTPLPYDDQHWIRFFHSRTMNGPKPWPWRYYVGAALMENKPPFKTVALSKHPILTGQEGYSAPYPFKPKVVFPGGAIQRGEEYLVSFGENDSASKIAIINKKDIQFHATI